MGSGVGPPRAGRGAQAAPPAPKGEKTRSKAAQQTRPFNDYVKICQDAGYTNDCYSEPGYFYYGADSDGYAIQLTYDQCNHYITILATDNPDMWNKWWIN